MRRKTYMKHEKASKLPAIKKAGWSKIEPMAVTAMQVNTVEDYSNRMQMGLRRDQTLEPVVTAISEQFKKDNEQIILNLGEYTIKDEYGATKPYRVTDKNSKLNFDVTFYFYGGVISGWCVEPDKTSYEKYRNGI